MSGKERIAEEYLQKLGRLNMAAENFATKIKQWEKELAYTDSNIAAPIASYEGERNVHPCIGFSIVERSTEKAEKLREKITQGKAELYRLARMLEEMKRPLELLPIYGQKVVEGRYIKGESWQKIGADYHRGRQWAARMHKQALSCLAEILQRKQGPPKKDT